MIPAPAKLHPSQMQGSVALGLSVLLSKNFKISPFAYFTGMMTCKTDVKIELTDEIDAEDSPKPGYERIV